jgi:hypothetical protein
VLAAVHEREAHGQRVEAQPDPRGPPGAPEEEHQHERVRSVQGRHRRDGVDQVAVLVRRLHRPDAEPAPDLGDDPRDRRQLARHPRRLRGIEPVGQEGGERQHDRQHRVAPEACSCDAPEHRGDDPHDEEMRHVDGPDRHVVPVQARSAPQVVLEPDRRHLSPAQRPVDRELRSDVRALRRNRDRAAQEVVGDEEAEERQPLEQHRAPAAPRGHAEGGHAQSEPQEELVASDRKPPAGDHGRQRHQVDERGADGDRATPAPPPAPGGRRPAQPDHYVLRAHLANPPRRTAADSIPRAVGAAGGGRPRLRWRHQPACGPSLATSGATRARRSLRSFATSTRRCSVSRAIVLLGRRV